MGGMKAEIKKGVIIRGNSKGFSQGREGCKEENLLEKAANIKAPANRVLIEGFPITTKTEKPYVKTGGGGCSGPPWLRRFDGTGSKNTVTGGVWGVGTTCALGGKRKGLLKKRGVTARESPMH